MNRAIKIVRGTLKATTDKRDEERPPDKKRYKITLKTAEDVRRLLSITLNQIRRQEIDVQIGRAMIYGSQIMLNCFEQCSIEDRLKKLENLTYYGGR
ncbi:MAG: hypothetical protein NT140_08970 [Deltaproteobacteria bacterium]|nr:hypothetical protein [Deltaproteobacteria bacterium]